MGGGVHGTEEKRVSRRRFHYKPAAQRAQGAGPRMCGAPSTGRAGAGTSRPCSSPLLFFGSWKPRPPLSRGHGAREAQLWRRCNTHSFNCTYTKKGEAVGLLGVGGCPGAAADSGGPQVPPTCACPGLGWAQDRLCKASEQNKLTVPRRGGLPACPLGRRACGGDAATLVGGVGGRGRAALWGTWARRRVP